MKFCEINESWRALAFACLKDAVKTADMDCIDNYIFQTLCGLALKDEDDVIKELEFAKRMKDIYGSKWYRKVVVKYIYLRNKRS